MMDCTLLQLIPSIWKISTTVSQRSPSIRSRTAEMFSGVVLVLGRRWWLVVCTASLPPRNSLCQNFTCVFDSVDSLYCARNLRQISLGPTFSLVRNFITTRCAVVTGTSLSLILNSTNWGEGESDGEVRRVPNPHHTTEQGHYPIVLICWLQLTEVGLYLIYSRINLRKSAHT